MNTVGKILVILNFLFALAIGALLIMVVALQSQWKEKYFALHREAVVQRDVTEAYAGTASAVGNDYRSIQLNLDRARQEIKEKEEAAKDMDLYYKGEITLRDNKLKENLITLALAKKLTQRQADEIALLNTTIESRQKKIVELEVDIKSFRSIAQNFESIARDKQTKNEGLLEQIRELTRALARAESGVNPDRMVILNPNAPNPPAVKIEGRILKVADNLIELSLGTDHGLKENNTLDVYRLSPEPKWLGTVRIVDARHHTSVGRLVPSSNTAFSPKLREGDLVTSKIK